MTWWRRDHWRTGIWVVRPRWIVLLALIGWAAVYYRVNQTWVYSDGPGHFAVMMFLVLLIVMLGTILEALTRKKKYIRPAAPRPGPARGGAMLRDLPGTDTSPPLPPLPPAEPQAHEEVLYTGRPSHWGYAGNYVVGAMVAAGGVYLLVLADPREPSAYPWGSMVLFLGVAIVAWAYLDRAAMRFEVTTRSVSLKKGILTRVVAEIPTQSVREIRMKQGPIGRMVNVGKLGFWSVSSADPEVVYRGVRDPDSLRKLVRDYSVV